MFIKIFYLVLLAVFSGASTPIRSNANYKADDQTRSQSRSSDDDEPNRLGSAEDEMRARNQIKYYEKLHQENIHHAREVAELSEKLRALYEDHRSFGQAERKNLERIEKLVRRIRSAAGGSNGDSVDNSTPRDLPTALSRLTEASDALRTGVEKTPRMVVSAAVIERSNELLQILRYLRTAIR